VSDITAVWDLLRARAEANITLPMFWQHETNELPDTPESFVYFEIDPARPFLAGFGGGQGNNRYRSGADFNAFVFVPVGQGVRVALQQAETVAALFRSFRSGDISCFEASVHPVGQGAEITPPGLSSAAGNYACAVAIVSLSFDQIG